MRAAVISINIGAYSVFWQKFYETAERYFLPDWPKEYFVFTDLDKLLFMERTNVHVLRHPDLGWPYNTLKRFQMFCSIENELRKFDYVFFANANCMFIQPLTQDFIVQGKKFITVEHPGMHKKDPQKLPYERRRESRACVLLEESGIYVQGAFFGGAGEFFMEMSSQLSAWIEADLKEGIIALWHDESFLNRYILDKKNDVQILGWQYLKYEEYIVPYRPAMVLRDKRKYLTNKNGRFLNQNYACIRLLQLLRNIKWLLLIKIHYYKWQETVDASGTYIDLDIT